MPLGLSVVMDFRSARSGLAMLAVLASCSSDPAARTEAPAASAITTAVAAAPLTTVVNTSVPTVPVSTTLAPTTTTEALPVAMVDESVRVIGDSVGQQIAEALALRFDRDIPFDLFVGARYIDEELPEFVGGEDGVTLVAIGLWDAAPFGDPRRVTEATVADFPTDFVRRLLVLRSKIPGEVVWLLPIGAPSHPNLDAVLDLIADDIRTVGTAAGDGIVQVDFEPELHYQDDGVHLSACGQLELARQLTGTLAPLSCVTQ